MGTDYSKASSDDSIEPPKTQTSTTTTTSIKSKQHQHQHQNDKNFSFYLPFDIISEILLYFSEKDDLFSIYLSNKEMYNYINFENPQCCQNIIFKMKHLIPYEKYHINRICINMEIDISYLKQEQHDVDEYLMKFDYSKWFPNMQGVYIRHFTSKQFFQFCKKVDFGKLEMIEITRDDYLYNYNYNAYNSEKLHSFEVMENINSQKKNDYNIKELKFKGVSFEKSFDRFMGNCVKKLNEIVLENVKIVESEKGLSSLINLERIEIINVHFVNEGGKIIGINSNRERKSVWFKNMVILKSLIVRNGSGLLIDDFIFVNLKKLEFLELVFTYQTDENNYLNAQYASKKNSIKFTGNGFANMKNLEFLTIISSKSENFLPQFSDHAFIFLENVKKLSLHFIHLKGTEFHNMKELKELELVGCGNIDEKNINFKSLKKLSIEDCKFYGTLFQNLTCLEELLVIEEGISTLKSDCFQGLNTLNKLRVKKKNINNVLLIKPPPNFEYLSNLNSLETNCSAITKDMLELNSLHTVNIENTKKYLDIQRKAKYFDNFKLDKKTAFESLSISFSMFSDVNFDKFVNMKKLFLLNCPNITGSSFEYLSKLYYLKLETCNNLKNDILKIIFFEMNSLRKLSVKDCWKFKDEKKNLMKIPKSKITYLKFENLKNITGRIFEKLPDLEKLKIKYCHNLENSYFNNFLNLISFKVYSCLNVNDELVLSLSKSNVEQVELSYVQVSGKYISNFKHLELLIVKYCKFTKNQIAFLKSRRDINFFYNGNVTWY